MGKRPVWAGPPENRSLALDARAYDEGALVSMATRYLLDHLSRNHSVGGLALFLGVAEDDLSRAFYARLGMTVLQYVQQERMCLAQRLLLQTSLSIEDVADRVGFASSSYFSKMFRRCVGTTPTEFRNNPPRAAVTAFQGSVLWG